MITSLLSDPVYSTLFFTLTFLASVGSAAYTYFHEDALIKKPIVYRNLTILCVVSAILFVTGMILK